jgi:hypothetical protein
MSEQNSPNTDQQQEAGAKFDRGTSLSIFHSDRREDFMALFFAMAIALGVYLLV